MIVIQDIILPEYCLDIQDGELPKAEDLVNALQTVQAMFQCGAMEATRKHPSQDNFEPKPSERTRNQDGVVTVRPIMFHPIMFHPKCFTQFLFHPILRFTQIMFHPTHVSHKVHLLKSFTQFFFIHLTYIAHAFIA